MKNVTYRLFFKAFSNETRLEILRLLRNGTSKNVTEIYETLGFKQSRVSRNLKCLADCGFVNVERNGKQRIYSLNRDTIYPMLGLIDRHIQKYQRHLVKCGVIR